MRKLSRSKNAAIARYRRGLNLEAAGWSAGEVAAELGYTSIDGWTYLKRHQKEASQHFGLKAAKTMSKNPESVARRYEEGIRLENEGLPPDLTSKYLGYSKPSAWNAVKKRMNKTEQMEATANENKAEKIVVIEEQSNAKSILTIEQKVMAILGITSNDLDALLDLVMEIKAK